MKNSPNSPIEKLKDFIRHPYAWPGGYPLFGFFKDGGTCCKKCAKKEYKNILADTVNRFGSSFEIFDVDVNWEDTDLTCDLCSQPIESAYGEVNE